ncbi:MAG TPA: YihY/virulence factor BrkB family protein [Humisphaera sp.]|nr:YihY/virulence factor BrkB family protein [Humisphaera sp.]
MLKKAGADWSEDNCSRLAAALSCYAVMALAPLLVILFKILSIAFRGPKGREHVEHFIETQVQSLSGFNGKDLIETILQKSANQGHGVVATIIGIAVLLFSASGVFGELQGSMNTIWEVKPRPHLGIWGILRQRFLSMSMVMGVAFLLLISLAVSTVVSGMTNALMGQARVVGLITDVIVSLIVITLLFAMIFKVLPDVKIPWRYVWSGALITAILFAIGKWGLTLYFRYGAPTSAYGAFGSLAAVVIWVYYSAMILFAGAEFAKVYARAHGGKLQPSEYAVPLTEEARIQQGIPHEHAVAVAEATHHLDQHPNYGKRPQRGPGGIIATGVAVGVGLTAWFIRQHRRHQEHLHA